MRAFVVDDNSAVRKVIDISLSSIGMDVEVSGDWDESLSAIKEKVFDLYFVDTDISGKDGYTLCEEIRKVSGSPVFMIVSALEEPDEERAKSVGATSFVTKPLDTKALLESISPYIDIGAEKEEVAIYNDIKDIAETKEEEISGMDTDEKYQDVDFEYLGDFQEEAEEVSFDSIQEFESAEEIVDTEVTTAQPEDLSKVEVEEVPPTVFQEFQKILDDMKNLSGEVRTVLNSMEIMKKDFVNATETTIAELRSTFSNRFEEFLNELGGELSSSAEENISKLLNERMSKFIDEKLPEIALKIIDEKIEELKKEI